MDGNKDEALRCLGIGKSALESGDRARALKFITKARRLDPSLSVDDLLSKLEGPSNDGPSESKEDGKGGDEPSGIRRRVPRENGTSSDVSYTEEQVSIVRKIRGKKDYYEILGLEKGCSAEDVKKAYRKLSLKVHPDKNKAPGAEEAFKTVSKAFKCLVDEESRKKYDVSGSDEPVYERRVPRRGHQGFNGGMFYEDVDADEIFRNFFYGGMDHRAAGQFNGFAFGGPGFGARMGGNGSGGSNLRTLIQLLPVILLLLLSILPSNEPVYSLSRSYNYQYQFTTQKGVNFYVKSDTFEQDYPSNSPARIKLETRIEHDYFSILSQNCRMEMERFHWGFVRETPHCDMLKKFKSTA